MYRNVRFLLLVCCSLVLLVSAENDSKTEDEILSPEDEKKIFEKNEISDLPRG
jgi:hypothetical protein